VCVCSEEFWSELFRTLSSQSRDGAALVYVTSALAQLPAVRVIDNVDSFRSVKHDVLLFPLFRGRFDNNNNNVR